MINLSFFFQFRYFSIESNEIKYNPNEDGDQDGDHYVNFSIAPHFIGHALCKQYVIANDKEEG